MASEDGEFVIPVFDLSKHRRKDPPAERESITRWIPKESKRRFEILQGESGLAFGRYLEKVIVDAIDHVWKKNGMK